MPGKGCFSADAGLSWILVLKGLPLPIKTSPVRHRRRPAHRLLLPGLVGLLLAGESLAGCARAKRPAEPPAASPTPAISAAPALPPGLNLTELESLEHDLEQSEQRLDAELARKQRLASQAPPPEDPAATPGSEPKKSADSVGAGARAGTANSGSAGAPERRPRGPTPESRPSPASPEAGERGSPCDLGCRALASMQRARARICDIAGPGPRCQAATERVVAAGERVRRAGCECLSGEND
ncbi:MAG TPA: hypothetical protein VI197_21190 [Polyangiaceae bacterium]